MGFAHEAEPKIAPKLCESSYFFSTISWRTQPLAIRVDKMRSKVALSRPVCCLSCTGDSERDWDSVSITVKARSIDRIFLMLMAIL